MIKRENYPNAYKEVYVILNNMDENEIKAIPISVIDKIKEKMNNDYKFELDLNKELQKQVLLKETKVILAYIFLNYMATPVQKETIKKKFNNDIMKAENIKGKYDGNLFEKEHFRKKSEKENNKIIVYKKENILIKIYNFLRNILKF